MNRMVITSCANGAGVLELKVPLGAEEAYREVRVTVEPAHSVGSLSQEEWRQRILETAGKWEGDFERPPQGTYEEREPLS